MPAMQWPLTRLSVSAVCVALVTLSPPLLADDAEPIVVSYAAPAECPSRARLMQEIQSRTEQVRPAWDGETARRFMVEIAQEGSHYRAELTIRDPHGGSSSRRVFGRTCEEAVAGAALVASIALNPTAQPNEVPNVPPHHEAPPGSSRNEQRAQTAPRSERAASMRAWAGGGVATGMGPEPAPTMHLAMELGLNTHRVLAPTLRATVLRSIAQTVDLGANSAEFTATAGRLELCPIWWSPARVSTTVCFLGELGSLQARGIRVDAAREGSPLIASLGGSLTARWNVTGVLFLDGTVGARAPLAPHRFFFRPDTEVYSLPRVSSLAQLGIGVQFL